MKSGVHKDKGQLKTNHNPNLSNKIVWNLVLSSALISLTAQKKTFIHSLCTHVHRTQYVQARICTKNQHQNHPLVSIVNLKVCTAWLKPVPDILRLFDLFDPNSCQHTFYLLLNDRDNHIPLKQGCYMELTHPVTTDNRQIERWTHQNVTTMLLISSGCLQTQSALLHDNLLWFCVS